MSFTFIAGFATICFVWQHAHAVPATDKIITIRKEVKEETEEDISFKFRVSASKLRDSNISVKRVVDNLDLAYENGWNGISGPDHYFSHAIFDGSQYMRLHEDEIGNNAVVRIDGDEYNVTGLLNVIEIRDLNQTEVTSYGYSNYDYDKDISEYKGLYREMSQEEILDLVKYEDQNEDSPFLTLNVYIDGKNRLFKRISESMQPSDFIELIRNSTHIKSFNGDVYNLVELNSNGFEGEWNFEYLEFADLTREFGQEIEDGTYEFTLKQNEERDIYIPEGFDYMIWEEDIEGWELDSIDNDINKSKIEANTGSSHSIEYYDIPTHVFLNKKVNTDPEPKFEFEAKSESIKPQTQNILPTDNPQTGGRKLLPLVIMAGSAIVLTICSIILQIWKRRGYGTSR